MKSKIRQWTQDSQESRFHHPQVPLYILWVFYHRSQETTFLIPLTVGVKNALARLEPASQFMSEKAFMTDI